jgi:plasmid replication initiation protein
MESELKEKNKEPNAIVFARQSFTPLQKDIFTLAVSQLETGFNVQPDLFNNKTVTITAKMLQEVSEKHYGRLKRECKDMTQKVLEISDDEKQEFHFIVPFPEIKYKDGIIELTMFSSVVQSFLELKNGYSEYYIRESLSLEEFNKKRLYEILSSYKKRNIPVWKVYDIELKKLLGMDIENDPYRIRPKQFANQVIDVCINAINDKTSIKVTYTRKKDTNGWYTVFEVTDKAKKKLPEEKKKTEAPKQRDEKSQRLYERLKGFGVREDVIEVIINEHQSECWKWLNANKDNMDKKKFKNPAGVLLVHLGLVQGKLKM